MTYEERDRIADAMRAARAGTSAHLELRIEESRSIDTLDAAQKHLQDRGFLDRPGRDAVVFFVAPNARRFAVYGDAGVHRAVGDRYWAALAEDIGMHFAHGSVGDAIVFGVERIATMLAGKFPKAPAQ